MKIGIIGCPQSGGKTIFDIITAGFQLVTVNFIDKRVTVLKKMFNKKKKNGFSNK